MQLWEALVLAMVQGFTEFLPVSSSGHLVLASTLLGVREPTITYEILVHFGTLIAIFVVFWQDILLLIGAAVKLVKNPKGIGKLWQQDAGVRMVLAIVVGTLPAVIVGLFFKDVIEQLFGSPHFVGYMLIITGTVLFVSDRVVLGKKRVEDISLLDGLIIGVGQALAVLPGVSRSGTTIATGLFRGLSKESAARFSFLLTIPAILGGMVLAIDDLAAGKVETPGWILISGTILAAITGYLAIKILLQVVRKGKLSWFAYYTWAVGALIIVLRLT